MGRGWNGIPFSQDTEQARRAGSRTRRGQQWPGGLKTRPWGTGDSYHFNNPTPSTYLGCRRPIRQAFLFKGNATAQRGQQVPWPPLRRRTSFLGIYKRVPEKATGPALETSGCHSLKMTQKCLKGWIWKYSQHPLNERNLTKADGMIQCGLEILLCPGSLHRLAFRKDWLINVMLWMKSVIKTLRWNRRITVVSFLVWSKMFLKNSSTSSILMDSVYLSPWTDEKLLEKKQPDLFTCKSPAASTGPWTERKVHISVPHLLLK